MSSRSSFSATDFLSDSAILPLVMPIEGGSHHRSVDLRHLLEMACDWYWTLDDRNRLVHLGGRQVNDGRHIMEGQLGRQPSEWSGVTIASAGFTDLLEALEERRAFYELPLTMRDDRGLLRYHVLTGEPVVRDDVFLGFHGTARDLTRQRRAEALIVLEHEVTRRLAEAATSRKVLQLVMQVICDCEHWETAGFFRVEDESGTTRLIAGWSGPGMGQTALDYYRSTSDKIVPANGILRDVIFAGEPRWVADLKKSQTAWAQRIAKTGERATFFAPVFLNDVVIGVFAFASRELREPDQLLLQTMQVVGRQVGQYLKRKEAEQVLRESLLRFRGLTDLSSDWYWEKGIDLRLVCIEGRAVDDMQALTRGRAIGKRFNEIGLDYEPDAEAPYLAKLDARLPFRDVVFFWADGDGRRRYVSISGEPILDRHGAFAGYRGVGRDITERRESELRIRHMATHDEMTGLPNRIMFDELLATAMRSSERRQYMMAVLFVDLDGFKKVNDTGGHATGDALLKDIARRLKRCVRPEDVVARFGGDEFVVIVQRIADVDGAGRVARKIIDAVAAPVVVGEHVLHVTASVGVCLRDDPALDERCMLRRADVAMYAAKDQGKNRFVVYRHDA